MLLVVTGEPEAQNILRAASNPCQTWIAKYFNS